MASVKKFVKSKGASMKEMAVMVSKILIEAAQIGLNFCY